MVVLFVHFSQPVVLGEVSPGNQRRAHFIKKIEKWSVIFNKRTVSERVELKPTDAFADPFPFKKQ